MKLEWSAYAQADRDAIYDYVVTDRPEAALGLDQALEAAIENLLDFPEMGRAGRVEGTRELVISGTPYIAAYQIKSSTIRVLRIFHGARKWPDELGAP